MYVGATYLANKVKDIFTAMGASNVTVSNAVLPGAVHNDWWGHHLRGGCRIGTDPTSLVSSLLATNIGSICSTPTKLGPCQFDTLLSGAGPTSHYARLQSIPRFLLSRLS